jgi:hypothetical protein
VLYAAKWVQKWWKVGEERQVSSDKRALRFQGISVINMPLVWFSLRDRRTVASFTARRHTTTHHSALTLTA